MSVPNQSSVQSSSQLKQSSVLPSSQLKQSSVLPSSQLKPTHFVKVKGSGHAVQAGSAGIAEVQRPPAAIGHCMNWLRATCFNVTCDQASFASRFHVSDEGPADFNPHACDPQSFHQVSKVHPQGKLCASSSFFVFRTDSDTHELQPNKSHTLSSTKMSNRSKHMDPCENNDPKDHHLEKPMLSPSWRHRPCMTGLINREGNSSASETATRRVRRSRVADSSRITIQVLSQATAA